MNYMDFSIIQVAEMCGLTVDSRQFTTECQVKCPFCDDRKKHLYLNSAKNQFYCQKCGTGGNALSLYALMRNIDNKTAFRELKEGIIGNTVLKPNTNVVKLQEISSLRPLSDRHDVYYDLLQLLSLSSKHRTDLHRRGLTDEVIEENLYKSLPKKYSREYAYTMGQLSQNHSLKGIPGFYVQHGKWQMYSPNGYFIPYLTKEGYIQGMQIRLDDETNGKYRWFSTPPYHDGKGFPEGTESPAYFHIAGWNENKVDTVYVTEGGLKADVASYLLGGKCVIGIPGTGRIEYLDRFLLGLDVNLVIEAFDMDKISNEKVMKDLKKMYDLFDKAGILYRPITWNAKYKGLDDYALAVANYGQKVA